MTERADDAGVVPTDQPVCTPTLVQAAEAKVRKAFDEALIVPDSEVETIFAAFEAYKREVEAALDQARSRAHEIQAEESSRRSEDQRTAAYWKNFSVAGRKLLDAYPGGASWNHHAAITVAVEERDRLKRGDFTPEEFQNLCHKFSEADRKAFCDGCAEYQRKLFGEAEVDALRSENERLKLRLNAVQHAVSSEP